MRPLAAALASLLLLSSPTSAQWWTRTSGVPVSRDYFEGRSLFEKVWEPGERSPEGGDGVGPLFNEKSCVACHHLAGVGGAGGREGDVALLVLLPGASVVDGRVPVFKGELEEFHPGLRNRTSLVLHRHATDPAAEKRLQGLSTYAFVQTRDDMFTVARSTRSTPALFGAGRIDRIPDRAIVDAAARTHPDFPAIKGRVSRLRDGRIGRFGWKGQTARLADFVRAACANELGLEVRGAHQPSLATPAEYRPNAIADDLSDAECDRLTAFVAALPAPRVRPIGLAPRGRVVFDSIGCAACHTPKLGDVSGLYSDLLLHDLGDRMRSFGGGYGAPPTIVDASPAVATRPTGEAGPTEWRTTPLWGVASSPPYLHDGRAATLDDAVLLHGGEAEAVVSSYKHLPPFDRTALLDFLRSLTAPATPRRLSDLTIRTVERRR